MSTTQKPTTTVPRLKLPPRALSEEAAARYIGMSRAWLVESRSLRGVQRLRARPDLPLPPKFFRVGTRTIRYTVEALDRWLLEQQQRTDAEQAS